MEAIKPLVEKHEASWFETLTALAVQIAREEEVDFLCCETGLGGRLDATNALPAVATLLTTVGLDHQRILGETRRGDRRRKAGPAQEGRAPVLRGGRGAAPPGLHRRGPAGSPCYFLDELARWDGRTATGLRAPGT